MNRKSSISKTVLSRTECLSDIREFVADIARQSGFRNDEISDIVLAVDEACTNIIKHAYQFAPDKEITVTLRRTPTALEIAIEDEGRSFDPAGLHTPNLKEHLTHYRRGGLGVYLMKKLMDGVEYDFQPGKRNRVLMVKTLPNRTSAARR